MTGQSAEISYPERPINMIVPWAAGGSGDLSCRVVADKIQEVLGQRIISIHRPGGGAALGTSLVAKAKPDGYTILFGSSTPMVVSPILKKLDYKLDDFVPVGMYGKMPFAVAVKSDARWKTLSQFIEEEKKSPGKLKVGTNGKLTTADLLLEMLNKSGGVKFTMVPFKSVVEVCTALLGEKVDAGLVAGTAGILGSGQVRMLAVAEEKRLEDLPEVATFKESGYPIVLTGRNSLWFPQRTPKEIVDKFARAQETAFKRFPKEIKEGLRKIDMYAEFMNPEETMAAFKREYALVYKIAEELGAVGKE